MEDEKKIFNSSEYSEYYYYRKRGIHSTSGKLLFSEVELKKEKNSASVKMPVHFENGEHYWGQNGITKYPPYLLHNIKEHHDTVIVAEGLGTADFIYDNIRLFSGIAQDFHVVGTRGTSHTVDKWTKEAIDLLRGKHVIITPDLDKQGLDYALDTRDKLKKHGIRVDISVNEGLIPDNATSLGDLKTNKDLKDYYSKDENQGELGYILVNLMEGIAHFSFGAIESFYTEEKKEDNNIARDLSVDVGVSVEDTKGQSAVEKILKPLYLLSNNKSDMFYDINQKGNVSKGAVLNRLKGVFGVEDPKKTYGSHKFTEIRGTFSDPKLKPNEIIKRDGSNYVNSFHGFKDIKDNGYKEEDIKPFKDHIMNVCSGNEKDAGHLTDWLAHNVQKKGDKVQWAILLIGSIEGSGKTVFSKLMRYILGERNVGSINSDKIEANFNSWACQYCIVGIDEMEAVDRSRESFHKAIKRIITDDYLDITKKYHEQTQERNFTNYICTTNIHWCIPLKKHDRRFFVINTPETKTEEYKSKQYFDALHDCVENKTSELYSWLLERDLTNFPREAPPTIWKDKLIENENENIEGFVETCKKW